MLSFVCVSAFSLLMVAVHQHNTTTVYSYLLIALCHIVIGVYNYESRPQREHDHLIVLLPLLNAAVLPPSEAANVLPSEATNVIPSEAAVVPPSSAATLTSKPHPVTFYLPF